MIIQVIALALFGLLAGLIVYLVGMIGWIVLKLLKEELHLKIRFGPEPEDK